MSETNQGTAGGGFWGWGTTVYQAFGWAYEKVVGKGQKPDPEDSFFDKVLDDEPDEGSDEGGEGLETGKVGGDTPTEEAAPVLQKSEQPSPPTPKDVTPVATKEPTVEPVKATSGPETIVTPSVTSPEVEKDPAPTLKSVKAAAQNSSARIMSIQRATGDTALLAIVVELQKACKADPIVPLTVDGLLKQAEKRVSEIEPEVKRSVKDLTRRQAEEVIKFNKEEKRLDAAGKKPGMELRAEFMQKRKIIDSTLASVTQNVVGKDDLSLSALGEQIKDMQAILVDLGQLKPDDVDEEVDESEPIAKSVTKSEYPFGAANKIPHIHNYDSGMHLKYLAGSKIKRINLIQGDTRYEGNIQEAHDYAATFSATPTQRKLARVLEALL